MAEPNFYAATASPAQVNALRSYFSHPGWGGRFEWRGLVGAGAYGAVVRVREYFREPNRPSRDFVIKQAKTLQQEEDIRREMKRLERVAGGLHIVQPIVLEHQNPFFDFDYLEAPRLHPTRRQQVREEYERLGYLLGPTLVMQPIENGTLYEFYRKAIDHEVPVLPNRLLWRFFLCLVRSCIAMAYPQPFQTPQNLENMPPYDGQVPSEFTHTDLHTGNVMLGNFNGFLPEHQITPILKLIDFGTWAQAERYNLDYMDFMKHGVTENIFSIGRIMEEMITYERHDDFGPAVMFGSGGYMTRARKLMARVNNFGPLNLDEDLAILVIQCLAVEEMDRPSLRDLFNQVFMGMQKPATSYTNYTRGYYWETDDIVRQVIYMVLHEAPAGGFPPGF
ncbi:hypothetical protein PG989_012888 [Apiospora arundinis]